MLMRAEDGSAPGLDDELRLPIRQLLITELERVRVVGQEEGWARIARRLRSVKADAHRRRRRSLVATSILTVLLLTAWQVPQVRAYIVQVGSISIRALPGPLRNLVFSTGEPQLPAPEGGAVSEPLRALHLAATEAPFPIYGANEPWDLVMTEYHPTSPLGTPVLVLQYVRDDGATVVFSQEYVGAGARSSATFFDADDATARSTTAGTWEITVIDYAKTGASEAHWIAEGVIYLARSNRHGDELLRFIESLRPLGG